MWAVPQADPVGLRGTTRSPAMVSAAVLLLYHTNESPWAFGVSLGFMSQAIASGPGRIASSTGGMTDEARRAVNVRGIRGYVIGSSSLANLRVDDLHHIFGDLNIFGGSDATTTILGGGIGIEARLGWLQFFSDVQYNWRSNAIYGRSAIPVRVGLHFNWGSAT